MLSPPFDLLQDSDLANIANWIWCSAPLQKLVSIKRFLCGVEIFQWFTLQSTTIIITITFHYPHEQHCNIGFLSLWVNAWILFNVLVNCLSESLRGAVIAVWMLHYNSVVKIYFLKAFQLLLSITLEKWPKIQNTFNESNWNTKYIQELLRINQSINQSINKSSFNK